ncbi:PREDICTED: protein CASC5, partial [Acanthisitta chloris]|uniref:protein CASC5 n=1 Tax=Acanthisitta chloris TaxID=57068 RepID=UPI0004F0FD7B
MNKIYADPNMENDNTEHIRGKRLSSILKTPRNPLDVLANGNELTQDITIEKRRKNSRRVSFANTINCRVFQRDLKSNTAESENTENAADKRDDVFPNQNKEPEAVPCEITGMNTLLHAPIQASVQQTEWEDAVQGTTRQDTTLIFSEENEMEMTASHTAVISRNLKDQQDDITEKIDVTSFLAGLNSSHGKAGTSKGFNLLSEPIHHPYQTLEQQKEATTVKKIDLNEFLMSLKSNEKALNPAEGLDKENVVPSQGLEDAAHSSGEFLYSHEPLNTCNVTRVFQGQEGGMEMTTCAADDVPVPCCGAAEAPLEQLERLDVTEAFADDGMDMTTSHTARMSFPLSGVGNQSLCFNQDLPSTDLDYSVSQKASNHSSVVQQDPQRCVRAEDREDVTVLRPVRTRSAIPGSVSSKTVFRGDKTVVFPKCDDMEMTGNYTDIIYNHSTTEGSSSCPETREEPVSTKPLPAESRHSVHGDRDVTQGLTAGHNPAAVSHSSSALGLASTSHGHMGNVSQAYGPAAGNIGFGPHPHSVAPGVAVSRFHPFANPRSGEKTIIFPEEDMDLTKTCVKNDGKIVDDESSAAAFASVILKPHFLGNRSTFSTMTDQEEMEMTKCHAFPIDDQSSGITAGVKEISCKTIPRNNQNRNVSEGANSLHMEDMDKENIEVMSVDRNIKRNMETNTKDLQMLMAEKQHGKNNFQASGTSSLAPSGSFISSNKPAPSGMRENVQLGRGLGINADWQNSERQEQTHAVRAAHKVLITQGDSKRHFSVGKAFSSREDLKAPPSADGLSQRDVEGLAWTDTSQPCKGGSQVPLFGEKSAVFPSGESMDLTGNSAVVVPGNNINVVLSERKAALGYLVQGGSETKPSQKGATMTMDNQEQPVGHEFSSGSGRKTSTMSGVKHFEGEKTILFSEAADMDMTMSHTVSAHSRVLLQHRSSSDATTLISRDQTCVLTCDMEMTKLDTTALHESMGKAVPQEVHSRAKTGRKSLKGIPGEKTVLFSLSGENDDMEMTQSHTAAIGHEIVQDKGELCSLSSAHPVKSVVFPGSQAEVGITTYCSADKTTGKVICDDKPSLDKEFGLPSSQTTVFAEEDMEITKPLHVALAGNPLQGCQPTQPLPSTSTILFSGYQAAMDITEAHTVDPSVGRDLCEGQVGQEAADDMETTASHTVAVNNNLLGFEEQQVSHTSTQQPAQHTHSVVVSSWRGKVDSSHTRDLNCEYPTKPKDKPSIPSSASSTLAFPNEKEATYVPSGTTPESVYPVSLAEKSMDVQAPQECDIPMANSFFVSREQGLTLPENLQLKEVSSKLPSNVPVDCREEGGDLGSQVALSVQGSDPLENSSDFHSTQRNQAVKEDSAPDLGLAGASLIPAAHKESKENKELSAEGETPPKEFQINSEQDKQVLVSDTPRDQTDPPLAPELSGVLSVCSKLKDLRSKSAAFSFSQTAFPDQLPKSSAQPEDTLRLGKSTVNEANNLGDTKEKENTGLEFGAAPIDANSGMVLKDKYPGINIPLGIFQPKLPNRRNPVSSVQDINTKSEKAETPVPVNTGETKSSRQKFSPSQFIAEEFLPVCQEEMDSNESVSSELMENEISKKTIPHKEKAPFEETQTCKAKRALEIDEEDLQSPKKVKGDENVDGEASLDLQLAVPQNQVEGDEDPPHLSAKSPDCPHASSSSSLDSVKCDTELTIQPSSQFESLLLTDSICEDNLWEKFQSGAITVGEFFRLLQVHVLIQKPRHSHLPANCAVSAAPTPEDLLYSQYIHRPKLRIYEEDCQALTRIIDELKPYAKVQDQLLVNVNRSLWEVMRTCSDEELKNFGAELNKMKSYFTKESKILAHNEKETLYSKLLQSAQEQHRNLQSRIEKVDDLLQEAESCLVALESDSFWDEEETNCRDGMAGGQNLQKELESLKAQEEELQRELSEMEAEDEQMLVQMEEFKQTEKSCRELLEKYDFTEWEITEWNEQQAVFDFLYDSVELTVVFGPPIDGDDFGEDLSRTIVSLNFESFLDEEQAPPSSCLVHRLIFLFIESQGNWQEKCPTLYYLPQVLHDISLVVSRCKSLGEEVEFLERWGGKFNLLKTEIKDTEVKLLFSASAAFAKFELSLPLSASYPSAPLPFSVQTRIGNIG